MLNWSKKHPWIFWFLLLILLLISFLPVVIKTSVTHGIYSFGKEYGIEKVTLTDIDINPFTGSLSLNNLQLFKLDEQQKLTPVTHIKKLDVELKMLDLFKERVNVESLYFYDAHLPIEIDAQNQVFLAGIQLTHAEANSEKDNKTTNHAFQFALTSVQFADIKVPVNYHNQALNLDIKRLTLNNLESWTEEFARLIVHATVNESSLRSNLQLHLFQDEPEIIGTFKASDLNLAELTKIIPDAGFSFASQLSTDMTFTIALKKQGLELFQQGQLKLTTIEFTQQNDQAKANSLSWRGGVIVKQNSQAKKGQINLAANINGELAATDLTATQAGKNAKAASLKWKGDINLKQQASDKKTANTTSTKVHTKTVSNLNLVADIQGQLNASKVQLNLVTDKDKRSLSFDKLSANGNTQLDLSDITKVALNQALNMQQFTLNDSTQKLNLAADLHIKTQAKINLASDKIDINHKGDLSASNLKLTQPNLNIGLESFNSEGSAQVKLAKNMAIKLQQNLQLDKLVLQESQQNLTLNTSANMQADSQITLKGEQLALVHEGDIQLTQFSASQAMPERALTATLEALNWQGNLNLQQQDKTNITTTGSVKINNIAVNNSNLKRKIINSSEISLAQLSYNPEQEIKAKNLKITDLAIGDKSLKKEKGLLSELQNLTLSQIDVTLPKTEQQVLNAKLGDIKLNGSESFITINKDNQLVELNALLTSLGIQPAQATKQADTKQGSEANSEQTAKANIKQDSSNTAKPIFSVNSVTVSGNNQVYISANNVQPPVTEKIDLKTFELGKINSQTPNQTSPYKLKVAFDEFSYLDSQGTVAVLNPTYALNATTEVESFPLTNLSGLSEQSIGYILNSGQLSAELKTELKQKKIKARNEVKIHKLELKAGSSDLAKKQQANFPVPLETGVAMLQDKNDNIKLNIPINGNIDNPDFNINDVINTALGKAMAGATRTYLLLALQPFGAIALAGEMAINKAGEIDLESIAFEPASTDITPKMQQYLAKLSGLLKERSSLAIKLCEGATQNERLQLTEQLIKADIKKQSKAGVKNIKVPDIKASDTDLLALAEERQKQIKRALIKLGVKSKQVIFCQPQIKDQAPPKVKLKI